MTARGCTNRCSYCCEADKALRQRSVKQVVAEIAQLVDRFGVREIQFVDSNFLAKKEYVKELCGRSSPAVFRSS